jgi:hypothetical protein
VAELVKDLASFLQRDVLQSWQPGTVDCCMFLASWAIWLGHRDPAAHLRGAYDSEDGFRKIIAEAGGVVPLVAHCVHSIQGRAVQSPDAGMIGVIGSATNLQKQWGAIFDGRQWIVRTMAGHTTFSATPLAIWDI